ncbi:MAG: hypothetical protein QGD94_00195 [Planctomycetia bacterium]|nr:hypothetical protein [Planctomycetia bacterium]
MGFLYDILIWGLGVKLPGVTGFESMRVEYGVSLPLFIVIAALSVSAVLALMYIRTQESLRLWKRFLLAVLRLVGMLIVVALVLGATIVLDVKRGKAPDTVFHIDRTPSMSYTDAGKEATRSELVDKALGPDSKAFASLQGRTLVRKKLVGIAETPMSIEGWLPHTLSQALLSESSKARAAAGGKKQAVSGGDVVVASDFNVDDDREALIDAARLIRAEGRRVHTVGVGMTRPTDAEVLRFVGSPYAYLGDYIQLATTIRCVGADGQQVVVTFFRNEENIGQNVIDVSGDPFETAVATAIEATKAGAHIYRVQVSAAGDATEGEDADQTATINPLDGETVLENNHRSVTIRTIDDKIRVLFIENHPRWEFRHIKRALEVDPVVAGTFYCRIPRGIGWYCQGVGGKKDPIIFLSNPAAGPPAKRVELFQYQVIILGDWGDKDLQIITTSDGQPFGKRLTEFVKRRGGGLLLWGGNNALGAGNYAGTPIEAISPVSLDVSASAVGAKGRGTFAKVDEGKRQIEGEFQLLVTEEGLMHPVFTVLSDPVLNREFWNTLPKLDGCTKVGPAKPGATVLAVHPKNGQAVIAAWYSGYGKVLVNAADTTFLWHLGLTQEQQEERLYERWISQLVRWASPDPLHAGQKVRIVTREKRFEVNKPLRVRVSLVDRFFNPVSGAQIEFRLRAPDGSEVLTIAKDLSETPGVYETTFLPEVPGRFLLLAKDLTGDTGEDQLPLAVTLPYAETSATALRADIAKQVAEAGGGTYTPIENIDELLNNLGTETRISTREIRARLATAPGVLGLLLLVFAAEWFIRKRSGLP